MKVGPFKFNLRQPSREQNLQLSDISDKDLADLIMLDSPGGTLSDIAEDDQMLSLDELSADEIKKQGDLIAKASLAQKQEKLV